jgi:hypothetical protein
MINISLIELTIDGKYYSFNQWTTSKGLTILARVSKIVGPAIFSSIQEGRALPSDILKDAAKEIVIGLGQEDLGSLCRDIVADVKLDNKPIPFDIYFGGNYKTLFKLVFEVLKANFSDLLGAYKEM